MGQNNSSESVGSAAPEIDLELLGKGPDGLAARLELVLRYFDRLRDRPEAVAFSLVVLLGVGGLGLWSWQQPSPPDVAELIPQIRLEPTVATTTEAPQKLVHVTGAVMKPGVYWLPSSARVNDAIAAAGGATSEGLIHQLNLAAPVVDGMQLRVPVVGEAVAGPTIALPQDTGPLNINTATETQLVELNGIGPSIAGAIVAYRNDNGPFASAEDLLAVPGIGPAKLALLADQVTT